MSEEQSPINMEIKYVIHGRYALYINDQLYMEYPCFQDAVLEFERRCRGDV